MGYIFSKNCAGWDLPTARWADLTWYQKASLCEILMDMDNVTAIGLGNSDTAMSFSTGPRLRWDAVPTQRGGDACARRPPYCNTVARRVFGRAAPGFHPGA